MTVFLSILSLGVLFLTILGIASIAGMFSEKVGITNIAVEGMMVIGAVFYGLFSKIFKVETGLMQIPLFIIAGSAAALFSLLHGFVTIKLKGDHIISGVAINLLAPAIAFLLLKAFGEAGKFQSPTQELALSQSTDVWQNIISLKTFLFIAIVVVSYILLKKTKWGLRLQSIGENPQAADVAGVNVNSYKWQGTIISGFLSGIAGGIFFQKVGIAFAGNVSGLGFLALAILIMGQWKVLWISLSAVFFSFIYALSQLIGAGQGVFSSVKDFSYIIYMIPFIITIFVLIFTSKNSAAPKAIGLPYDKSKR